MTTKSRDSGSSRPSKRLRVSLDLAHSSNCACMVKGGTLEERDLHHASDTCVTPVHVAVWQSLASNQNKKMHAKNTKMPPAVLAYPRLWYAML